MGAVLPLLVAGVFCRRSFDKFMPVSFPLSQASSQAKKLSQPVAPSPCSDLVMAHLVITARHRQQSLPELQHKLHQ